MLSCVLSVQACDATMLIVVMPFGTKKETLHFLLRPAKLIHRVLKNLGISDGTRKA